MIRKSEKPLQQIVKRLAELDKQQKVVEPFHEMEALYKLKFKHNDGPSLQNYQDFNKFKQINFINYCITGKTGNNCVLLTRKEVVVGKSFNLLTNLFLDPFDSTDFDIYKCTNLSTVMLCGLSIKLQSLSNAHSQHK